MDRYRNGVSLNEIEFMLSQAASQLRPEMTVRETGEFVQSFMSEFFEKNTFVIREIS